MDAKIIQGFRQAKNITQKYAKTFYLASLLLPKDKQSAAYSVYSLCRISDESVDNAKGVKDAANLDIIREKIQSAYQDKETSDSLLLAFRETISKYQIPQLYFDELLQGMHMDLNKNRYLNFDELYTYCYKVAGVVGLIMLKIFGPAAQEAEKYALTLGVAMQLTNILRDVKEDYNRGRIYLPKDEMDKFGVSENQIAGGIINENWIKLLQFHIQRARKYYQSSSTGIKMIKNTRARLVVCMMKDMYAGILNSIERNKYDVFSRRAHVTTLGKLGTAVEVLAKREFL